MFLLFMSDYVCMYFLIDFGFCTVKVYPKVKVPQEEEEEDPSLYDHPSPDPPHVRPHISTSDAKISVKKAGNLNTKVYDQNSKTSSVLPPRAVLSSPENDSMHGTKYKNKTKTQASNHNLSQNTHVKCTKSYELEKRRRSWK